MLSVKTRMVSRRKTFSISIPASASNSFKICPPRWMSVTLTPKRAKNCANSHAIAPPPRTMSDFGSRFRVSASSLVMKPMLSSCANGDGATLGDRLGELTDPEPSPESHAAGMELRVRIQQGLAQLSPELREAVVLRDLEDMDYKEIAQVLRIPEGTVKSRISRGRGELARLLHRIEGQVV